jgi:hypothetical protein
MVDAWMRLRNKEVFNNSFVQLPRGVRVRALMLVITRVIERHRAYARCSLESSHDGAGVQRMLWLRRLYVDIIEYSVEASLLSRQVVLYGSAVGYGICFRNACVSSLHRTDLLSESTCSLYRVRQLSASCFVAAGAAAAVAYI